MSIQVNIFSSGSVPTATELANFINELNTDLDSIVTLNTEQVIEGAKTFWGSKMLKFKQKVSADKLGFTFYDYQGKEVGNFEYDNKNNFRLLALGNYYSAANQEIEGHVGFKVYNKSALSAYRLLCPLAGNVKNSIPSLTDTYTNFYMPLIFTNGAASVMADNTGKVDLSTLIGSGGGDVSGLATVATTGDYNDLLNLPTLFSGSYNDLTGKPTLFSGSYNDLTNKPTIPNVPSISTNISNDATSDIKTASPKAVKDFVEGKGYLTQHQDISGKADQTDLEALEDRVEALEQGDSGSTDEDKSVKLVKDPANYLKTSVGDIIKYNGTSTSDFIHGHDYECTKKGNAAYSVSSGDYVLDVAESATNEEFIAAMANEVKPFKYSESIDLSDYIEYCAVTNPNLILGKSTKTKSNLVVGDVLVSTPDMTPVSVVTEVSDSDVKVKFLSTGYTFSIKNSGGMCVPGTYSYIFTNPEGAKVIITDGDFLTTMTPEPYPPSSTLNYSNKYVAIVGKGTYSGTGTNITITKYYQSAEVAGTPSEWVEAKPCDCNDGGDTTQYSYLKLIPDLDAYTEAPVGEIVKYTGQSNNKYTRGWDYEKVASGDGTLKITSDSVLPVPGGTRPTFPFVFDSQIEGLYGFNIHGAEVLFLSNSPQEDDILIGWEDESVNSYVVESVNSSTIVTSDFNVNRSDLNTCTISKFKNTLNEICLIKGPVDSISSGELDYLFTRCYFSNNSIKSGNLKATSLGGDGLVAEESATSEWQPILMPTASNYS